MCLRVYLWGGRVSECLWCIFVCISKCAFLGQGRINIVKDNIVTDIDRDISAVEAEKLLLGAVLLWPIHYSLTPPSPLFSLSLLPSQTNKLSGLIYLESQKTGLMLLSLWDPQTTASSYREELSAIQWVPPPSDCSSGLLIENLCQMPNTLTVTPGRLRPSYSLDIR